MVFDYTLALFKPCNNILRFGLKERTWVQKQLLLTKQTYQLELSGDHCPHPHSHPHRQNRPTPSVHIYNFVNLNKRLDTYLKQKFDMFSLSV